MSSSEGPLGPGRLDPYGCDPEKIFELADTGRDPDGPALEQERKIQEHLVSCSGCRELYEHELDLNTFLHSLDFSEMRSRSVSRGVVMALPTRSAGVRILWGLLATALLAVAFVSLEFNGTEPVILAMSILSTCWGFIVGVADATREIFVAVAPIILYVLALGALADLFVALVIIFLRRRRRVREA
jgi:predicted anti-sigma-YlaC factor YlaD